MKFIRKILIIFSLATTLLGSSITAAASNSNTMDTTMFTKINDLRSSKGLSPLTTDSELVEYAEIRAQEISTNFSHTRPDGSEGIDIIPLSRTYAGENLSYCTTEAGIKSAADTTFNALINSPTHLDNMLAMEYTKIGIASYEVNGRIYVAYLFSN